MSRLLLLIFLFVISHITFADQFATTDSGERVILHDNGSWEYLDDMSKDQSPIGVSGHVKPILAVESVTGARKTYTIWFNPDIWIELQQHHNQVSEYEFQIKDGSAFAIVIYERAQIPVEQMKNIMITNAKRFATDVSLITWEKRNVNESELMFISYSATMKQMEFIYACYVYSDANGTLQFMAYTNPALYTEMKQEMADLLNGLVINK